MKRHPRILSWDGSIYVARAEVRKSADVRIENTIIFTKLRKEVRGDFDIFISPKRQSFRVYPSSIRCCR